MIEEITRVFVPAEEYRELITTQIKYEQAKQIYESFDKYDALKLYKVVFESAGFEEKEEIKRRFEKEILSKNDTISD